MYYFLQIVIYRYDDWLNGQDYGRHPEEPNAKLTPANPPTAEEFMVNNRNKDKKIPLCLLEPKEKKKRRHPIHKNKNLGESMNFVSCPNYTYEILAWLSFGIMTQCAPG